MSRLVDFIIPARNETYLQRTIENVLANIRGDSGIIAICDGYWPDPPIKDHPRVTLIHHTESIGQRAAINEAAAISRAKFIMKIDAHTAVAEGIDVTLAEDWQPGWTMVPTMFNLDHETWEPKRHKKTVAMYLTINEKDELRAEYYGSRQPKFNAPIHETMACMGCGWLVNREEFLALGACDEGHGSWGAQSVEVSMKAWLSGGALMCDENTWFSHFFRGGGGPGFPYPISGRQVDRARQYSKDLWLNDRWPLAKRKLRWLIEKFNPPGWEQYLSEQPIDKTREINTILYHHLHRHQHEPHWRGVQVVKMPTDMLLYHQIIWQERPKWIIETGTRYGGSALFFQDCLDLVGEGGRVVTIDIDHERIKVRDPRIRYIKGNSTDEAIIAQVREMVGADTCMVVLDSDHRRVHVKNELWRYSPLVTKGQYLVVEDCYASTANLYHPGEARDWFLKTSRGREFVQTNLDRYFVVGVCVGGWLRRK